MRRTLRLSKETLSELSPGELQSVAGAALPTLYAGCQVPTIQRCLTGMYPTLDGCTS